MRIFKLKRSIDNTGVSGTGYVAEGIEFSNGKVVVCWIGNPSTVVYHENIDSVRKIHCTHSGTEIKWIIELP